jgi:hypothetical protein
VSALLQRQILTQELSATPNMLGPSDQKPGAERTQITAARYREKVRRWQMFRWLTGLYEHRSLTIVRFDRIVEHRTHIELRPIPRSWRFRNHRPYG